MPDWTKPMIQTFEFFKVDGRTWKDTEKLDTVLSASITRDSDAETLGSARFTVTGELEECYIRTYLLTEQGGIKERFPLGTHLAQTPSQSFNGKYQSMSLDAYTPLIELKENPPPLGYAIPSGTNIIAKAKALVQSHARSPVVAGESSTTLDSYFIANANDKWLSFLKDLLANADSHFEVDETGRIIFAQNQDARSMQPVWIYSDDNSSILLPSITVERDLYGIPNVVEVVFSNGSQNFTAIAKNENPLSPISTVARGREIIHRETKPELLYATTQAQVNAYAKQLLRDLSCLEYTVSYSHGFCPVRVGDCVRLNYTAAGIEGINARVVSQTINCATGCTVQEKAKFSISLIGGDA